MPSLQTRGADAELIGNAWCHIVKLQLPGLGCQDRTRGIAFNLVKDDRRVRDHMVVDIGEGPHKVAASDAD